MIVKDNVPLSVTEHVGFNKVMKTVAPLFKLPSRKQIIEIIDKKYENLSEAYKMKISETEHLTLTLDIWTETMTSKSFLGVTSHFVDDVELVSCALGMYELSERHTAGYLADVLSNIEKTWNISSDKIVAVVTDGASNIVKAAQDKYGKSKHIHCFAHAVNLVAVRAFTLTSDLPEFVNKVKAIVTFFKQCMPAADELRKIQIQEGQTEGSILKLKQDMPTRWNSTYYMIMRFISLIHIVSTILIKFPYAPQMISALELEMLKDIAKLLRPLEMITLELSSDSHITCSKVIPLIHSLTDKIEKIVPETDMGNSLKLNINLELSKRFSAVENVHIIALSTILDPRFKRLHFKSPVAASHVIQKIATLMKENIHNKAICQVASTVTSSANTDDLWSYHKKVAATIIHDDDSPGGIPVEFRQYLHQPISELNVNPLEIWSNLKLVYPNVHKIAMKYLPVVATSVPTERLFSKAGNTLTQYRNRIVRKRLSKLLFLNSLPDKSWKV